jgi:phosphatidate cytidylyltransferase
MLSQRILTAFVLLALASGLLFLGKIPFLLFITSLLIISQYEIYRMSQIGTSPAQAYWLIALFPWIGFFLCDISGAFLGISLATIIALIKIVIDHEQRDDQPLLDHQITDQLLPLWYIPICGVPILFLIQSIFEQTVNSMYFNEAWKFAVWAVGIIIITDTGAYFFGKGFGKRKLAPRISPGKTIEGTLGGTFSAVSFSIAFPALIGEDRFFVFIFYFIIGFLISIFAQFGDLFESLIKRRYNVKDSGKILPGHGGVFDRIDGYLPAGALLAVVIFTLTHIERL